MYSDIESSPEPLSKKPKLGVPHKCKFEVGDIAILEIPPRRGTQDGNCNLRVEGSWGDADLAAGVGEPANRLMHIIKVEYDNEAGIWACSGRLERDQRGESKRLPEMKVTVEEVWLKKCPFKFGDTIEIDCMGNGKSFIHNSEILEIGLYGKDFIYKVRPEEMLVSASYVCDHDNGGN